MSKLPPLKRLVLEDFPSEVQEWAPKLIEPLNQFMAAVSGGLDRKLTLAENCVAQFRTLTITIDGDSGGNTAANGSGTAGSLAKWTDADSVGDASASDVLAIVKTVDGAGSGLDADTVDGQHASDFVGVAGSTADHVAVWKADGSLGGVSGLVAQDLKLGIGRVPDFTCDLGAGLANTKLAVFNSGTGVYGIGVQSSQFRFHTSNSGARFSWLNAPAGTETMSLDGSGNLTVTGTITAGGGGGSVLSGVATMASGATSKAVTVSGMTTTSKVVATPNGPTDSGGWSVTTAAGSFTIHTPTSAPFDLDFMWIAVL